MDIINNLELYHRYHIKSRSVDYIESSNPTTNVNPPISNAIWWNRTTGELFLCIDNTPDKNIWKGTNGTIISPSTLTKFDIFNDNSSLLALTFDNTLTDLGGRKPIKTNEPILYDIGKYGTCIRAGSTSQIVYELPELELLDVVTVSAWIKWYGYCCVMPFGFYRYDLYFCCNKIGFNTGNADLYGNDVTFAPKEWVHVVAKFVKGDYRNGGQIWINGEPITMLSQYGAPNTNNAVFGTQFYVFGWGAGTSYRYFGYIDQLRVFNRELTTDEILYLAKEV